jgi:lipopolysaccharide transport system ATP-binding protein
MDTHIILKNVSIEIPIYTSDSLSLRKKILGKSGLINKVRVLNGIDLKINAGDRVGLYGHNGAGKTSLLRCIAGGYYPTTGSLDIAGSLSSMIDIGLGLDHEATGYQNIKLKLGAIDPKLRSNQLLIDEIIDFSGLGEAIHWPIRTYSSGMGMRLAFSIATSIRSDILVLDEWLSVGDEGFSEKSKNRMNDLLESSSILVIASHNKNLLHSVCNRVIHLDHGRILLEETI